MVIKNHASGKKGKAKVGKLNVNKETVKDLSPAERKKIKGGAIPVQHLQTCINSCAVSQCRG